MRFTTGQPHNLVDWAKFLTAKPEGGFAALSMPMPGPIAVRAVADAMLPYNLSVREQGGNNHGPAVKIYLKSVGLAQGDPWCEAYVFYRESAAAKALLLTIPSWMPRTGSTVLMATAFKKKGLFISVSDAQKDYSLVKRGDHAWFFFASKDRIAHTGIVIEVYNWGVVTVEGNTGPESGVNRDGDGVFVKHRAWAEFGRLGGFGRQPF